MFQPLIECTEKINDKDFDAYFKTASHIISLFSVENPIHDFVVCEVLKTAKIDEFLVQKAYVRELVKECAEWNRRWNAYKKGRLFTEEHRFCLDELFSNYVANLGPFGKKLSQELLYACKEWGCAYLKEPHVPSLFKLWVDLNMPPVFCRYIKLLAEILWEDRMKDQVKRHKKHLPALTQNIQRPVSRFLSPKAKVVLKNMRSEVMFEGKMIAEMMPNEVNIKFDEQVAHGHYEMTPYAFHPRLGHKLTDNCYIDLGQGLLDCLAELYEKRHQCTANVISV